MCSLCIVIRSTYIACTTMQYLHMITFTNHLLCYMLCYVCTYPYVRRLLQTYLQNNNNTVCQQLESTRLYCEICYSEFFHWQLF